ncbi:MAG: DNA polymerase III subunit beta [Enterococcaceae bacterium]|jgi:DNA polymerase-3 subunit beta|nr:DNA polymerase III subunit beta [Enterococcaceae bacterium]
MKFSMNRNQFLQALQTVQRAITSKTTIPILTGVKIALSEENLVLTGSNADISIETTIRSADEKAHLEIESVGGIVLPARFFSEIVKKLPDPEFSFEKMSNQQVLIVSGAAEFIVNGQDADNYPRLPVVDSSNQFKISAKVLSTLINETVFAVSVHESRPILTGVHFILREEQLKVVATDSHRLSQRVIPLTDGKDFNLVIPGKSLLELSRSIAEDEEDVTVAVMENQVLFKTKDTDFYSRLLEGNYPDTDRLIPSEFNTEIVFNSQAFLNAIDRASLLSHEGRNNMVKLLITDAVVKLTGNSPEIGRVEEVLEYEKVSGEPLEIAFNPDYMKEALRAFGDVDILIQFISPIRPFILKPANEEASFIQLITPIRTN